MSAGPTFAQQSDAFGPDTGLQELKRMVDPTLDDWSSEVQAVRVRDRLEALTDTLCKTGENDPLQIDGWFTDNATVDSIGSFPTPFQIESIHVLKLRPAEHTATNADKPNHGLGALRRLLSPFDDVRASIEVVGITDLREKACSSDTRIEFFCRRQDLARQISIDWAIEWIQTTPGEWRIRRIRLTEGTIVDSPSMQFRERTEAIITNSELWETQLSKGVDHWYGNIDAVGELNQLGHQGIAIADVNGDGLEDLYVAMGEGVPNKLLVRQADGTVRDESAQAGVDWLDTTRGVLFVDIDGDGDQDLLCAIASSIILCKNNGDGTFVPARAFKAPTPEPFYSLAAADYDNDGDLDIFATRSVNPLTRGHNPAAIHDARNGPSNHLMRNDGMSGFTDATKECGLGVNNTRFSFAASWYDFDDDGDQDLYVANDFGPNNLYRNDGGVFVDVAGDFGVDGPAGGMGVSWSDYNLDGNANLLVSGIDAPVAQWMADQSRFLENTDDFIRKHVVGRGIGNVLFAKLKDSQFENIGVAVDSAFGDWTWGAQFVDLNNDGFDDVVAPNGFLTNDQAEDLDSFWWRQVAANATPIEENAGTSMPFAYWEGWLAMSALIEDEFSWGGRQRNRCYFNAGDGNFIDVSAISGLDFADDGRTFVASDWDLDGDLDLWLKNRTGPTLRFMENTQQHGNAYLSLKLEGEQQNRDAIGAKITIAYAGKRQTRTVFAGSGYLSQSSRCLHFGLGDAKAVDGITVRWPNGKSQGFKPPALNRRYIIRQEDGSMVPANVAPIKIPEASNNDGKAASSSSRLVLKIPLAIPPSLLNALFSTADRVRPVLVTLWEYDCNDCVDQLAELARQSKRMNDAGLNVVALNIDKLENRRKAIDFFRTQIEPIVASKGISELAAEPDLMVTIDAIVDHIRGRMNDWPMPLGLLVDGTARIQIVYFGPVDIDQLLIDQAEFVETPRKPHLRSSLQGRWYFRSRRNLEALAEDLKYRRRREDSLFYMKQFLELRQIRSRR